MIELERRRRPRLEVPMDARLAFNGATWVGKGRNLSLGGLYMSFPGRPPADENQPIILGIQQGASVLQIRGRVRWLREEAHPASSDATTFALGVAVEFESLNAAKEAILASLLDELQVFSLSIAITGLLIPQDTGDLLLEVSAAGAAPVQARYQDGESPAVQERRLLPRVSLKMPLQLACYDTDLPVLQTETESINLSAMGVSFRFKGGPIENGDQLVVRLSPGDVAQEGKAVPASDWTMTGKVVWAMQETSSPSRTYRLGVRFLNNDLERQRRIAYFLAGLVASTQPGEENEGPAMVTSAVLELRNSSGQRIVGYHDKPEQTLPGSPLVIISPGYGETKREYIELAYYLALHGFHVIRYDHTNHVGESEGEIINCTLTSMKRDLLAVIDFAERTWPTSPIALIATSLMGRVALKVAAEVAAQRRRLNLLMFLTSVMDVQATLSAVHQEDLIVTFLQGVRRGVINMLGFNIDADQWLEDAVKAGYADLRSTIQDAQAIQAQVLLFAAEHDTWVRLESVKQVQEVFCPGSTQLFLIPEALHRLQENPRKARAVYRHLVACCQARLCPELHERGVVEPSKRMIGLQNRSERDLARAQYPIARTDDIEFWRDYLDHFHYITNIRDYWQLLDHIYRLMGTLDGGERILDAGCGNGNFGMFMLINHAYGYRTDEGKSQHLRYAALDFVPDALAKARLNLMQVSAQLGDMFPTSRKPASLMEASFTCADLNMPLPFSDDQFDRIICNLVVGYVQDPSFTLNELMRVLAPKGKVVITNLKPHSDLSQIYRNFVQRAEQPEEVEEGRRLLNNSGKIKQGESEGIFRFFERQELAMLLISSGATLPRIYSTFANQAYIAVAEKPAVVSQRSDDKVGSRAAHSF